MINFLITGLPIGYKDDRYADRNDEKPLLDTVEASPSMTPSHDADAPINKHELAAFWNEVLGKAERVVVPLNECETGPAFYCVHALSGAVTDLRHLARLLGPQQRFYGVQAPTARRSAEFAPSIESIAQYYVDALIAFQPEGPFALGGWSAGAVIALEMAQQLRARRREVGFLVAFDAAPFNTGAGISPWNPLYYWKLACNLPRWIMQDELMKSRSLQLLLNRIWSTVIAFRKIGTSVMRGESITRGHAVEGFMNSFVYSDAQMSFMKALFDALYRYIPKAYSGRVLLYAAKTQPLYHLRQVEAAWSKIAFQLEIISFNGTHNSMLKKPQGIALAEHLRKRLAEFSSENPTKAICAETIRPVLDQADIGAIFSAPVARVL